MAYLEFRPQIEIGPPDPDTRLGPGGIPGDLYVNYIQNQELYAALGKPPPRHYDETVPGQVTVTSYAEPEAGRTFVEPEEGMLTFDPRTRQPVTEVLEAGFPLAPIIAGIGGAIGGMVGIPDVAISGAATAISAAQAVGPVEDYGGIDDMAMVRNGGMVPVSGPGVPEPPREMVAKQWKTKAFSKTAGEYWVYFFKLIDGRIMCYNAAKGSWKMWRPKKPIVLYRGKVTLSQAVRTQRMLDKLWKTVAKKTKALKMA